MPRANESKVVLRALPLDCSLGRRCVLGSFSAFEHESLGGGAFTRPLRAKVKSPRRPSFGQPRLPFRSRSRLLQLSRGTELQHWFGRRQFASLTYADSTGNLYLTGGTVFTTFPTTPGVVQPILGSSGSFLAKVDPTGHHLVFSTYLPFHTPVSAMTVDAAGNIYVAGGSTDSTIPIPSGSTPYRTSGSLGILKLNPTATTVLAATYLGGSGADRVGGIALDSSNNLYITGRTLSNDFPISASPLQASLGTSGRNGFVTVLNSSLTAAVYSTYLGGNSFVETGSGHSIAVDASKNAYVTGDASTGFPGTNGSSAQASCSNDCVFVAKLNPTGSAISYGTYLGTDARGRSIAVDALQNIYVSGVVNENGFNELNRVSTFPSCNANLNEGENFASKIAASGALAFSTCFAGSSSGNSALDSSGNMYVFGAGSPLCH